MISTAYRKTSITIPAVHYRFGLVLAKEAVRAGERPNFSSAIRMLIDDEITRRGKRKAKA